MTSSLGSTDALAPLRDFLERLPAINLPAGRKSIGSGIFEDGNWWVKCGLNAEHPLAWRHVQELGYVHNYVSAKKRLSSGRVRDKAPSSYVGARAAQLNR